MSVSTRFGSEAVQNTYNQIPVKPPEEVKEPAIHGHSTNKFSERQTKFILTEPDGFKFDIQPQKPKKKTIFTYPFPYH